MKKDNPLNKLKLPNQKELDELTRKRHKDLKDNINCLSNWFPLVKDLNINIPKTKIIHFPLEIYEKDCFDIFDGKEVSKKLEQFEKKLIQEVEQFGYPCFMKSGTFSSKHDWEKTCSIKNPKDSFKHWLNIMYNGMVYGAGGSHFIVLRELIDTKKELFAFNNTPITKERRYFFENNKITKHHPYWPPQSLKNNIKNNKNWEEVLDDINHESLEEIKLLKKLSLKVGKQLEKLHKNWSIDWLKDINGNWWLIDVAVMEQSYCWNEYKNLQLGL